MNNSVKYIASDMVVPMICIIAMFSVFNIASIAIIPYDKVIKYRIYIKGKEMVKEFIHETRNSSKSINRG